MVGEGNPVAIIGRNLEKKKAGKILPLDVRGRSV